jgi:hypothetical protein
MQIKIRLTGTSWGTVRDKAVEAEIKTIMIDGVHWGLGGGYEISMLTDTPMKAPTTIQTIEKELPVLHKVFGDNVKSLSLEFQ